ncbi:N-acetylmuramoyl-L-alanine amidase LytC precursor [Peptostreptococcus anaerobius]|uniref:N-acetylmuramoyl-L-alanine amidase LytC n=1 Tax=Peptostreptococcus anaerobius TaxID=1261 RepID=A0A379CF33_9FIRM|nr:cell wall-binding repeat-containing protein [Peptostreptococcus anaerobius]KXB71800.1 GA module [Peptostreptococcus anaerobius]MDU0964794.1 cell wall-binding repeat-containing protein [Peptostreptococcus anaerobius]MDU0998490.1 cell wall-binding repeat-containing protein [Peptostreptococcus anaerobius]SFN29181.1 Putative cell wall-binding protein [Peptostreptococcus anaerobius]SUB60709.1 N-acetylmuramoyl-L-alanine amidase LytC precursor [Peptostreptococcus anaerobius]
MFKKTSSVALSLAILLSTGSVALANQNLQGLDLNVVEKINTKNIKGASNQEVTDLQNELKKLIDQAEDTDTLVLKTDESINKLKIFVKTAKTYLNSEDTNKLKSTIEELDQNLIQIGGDENNIKDIYSLKTKPQLEKGVYNVPIVLRNFELTEQNSMGNNAIMSKAKLIVDESGKIRLRFNLRGLYFMGAYGHLTNLWYYNNTKEENVDKSHLEYLGELTRVKVLKTKNELDAEGNLRDFLKSVEINIDKHVDNPKRYLKVKVDAMDMLNGINPYENLDENSTSPNAILTLDYRFIEKDPTNNENPYSQGDELEQAKKEAKISIDNLSKLDSNSKAKYKADIDNAESKEKINEVLKEAKYANDKIEKDIDKSKKDAKSEIDRLTDLSSDEKTNFKNKIDSSTSKESIEAIVKEAKDLNKKKKDKNKKKSEKIQRLSGDNRYETSVEVSEKNFKSVDTVVLASGQNIADALVASSYADIEEAPILLTNKNSISDEVLDEIERLKADKVVIVGGQSSISSSVESRLKKEDIKVTRISGRDRFDTSDKLSQEVSRLSKKSSQAILVNGYKNIDALSVSSLATKEDLPILLNGRNTLNMSVKNRLKQMNVKKVYIIGGNNSISSDVEKELNRMQISVVRLSGTDRYETSANIAKYAYKDFDEAIVASGENPVDALAASTLTGKKEAPILLTNKNKIPKSIKKIIEDMDIGKITIVGGENSITDNVMDDMEDML